MAMIERHDLRPDGSADLTELSNTELWEELRHNPDYADRLHDALVAGTELFPGATETAIAGFEGFRLGVLYGILDSRRQSA